MSPEEITTWLRGLTRAQLVEVSEALDMELRQRQRDDARPPDAPQRSGRGRIYIGGVPRG
jgi:hypothetical protein